MAGSNFDIRERTIKFSIRIIKITQKLPKNPAGFALASQLVRSGTSVGANIEEAQDAISKKEFVRSMDIALKEARETYYWLIIILKSGLISDTEIKSLLEENLEIIKILRSIVKKSRLK